MAKEHDAWITGIGVNVQTIPTAAASAAPVSEIKALKAKIRAAQLNAQNALDSYNDQLDRNADQWFVSAFASLGCKDPGPELTQLVETAKTAAANAAAAVDANDLGRAREFLAAAEAAAERAGTLAETFTGDLIKGAENSEKVIKVVDTGAKVVGAVALTVGTGGAAAVVAGTAVSSAAVGTAATATLISVGGGMAASLAGALTKAAIGDKVDWGLVSVDILIQGLLARFGGNLAEGVSAAVAQRLGAGIAPALIKNVVTQTVLHVDSTILRTAAESVYKELSRQDITWKQVIDSLVAQLTDPSALAVAAASAGAGTYVSAKGAAPASSSENSPGKKSLPTPESEGNPAPGQGDAEIDHALDNMTAAGELLTSEPSPVKGLTDAEINNSVENITVAEDILAQQPKLTNLKQEKQNQHSYVLSKQNKNKATEKAAANPKNQNEPNQRLIKLYKVQDGKTPAGSMLNRKYGSAGAQKAVRQTVEHELSEGRYTTDKNGGISLILDMGEPTGWVIVKDTGSTEITDVNSTVATKLDIRIDTKGNWHFFPTN